MTRIQSVKLTGHKKPVTCLANNSHIPKLHKHPPPRTASSTSHVPWTFPNALLSGSEDGTVRLWDLKMNSKRAALCITCPFDTVTEEVTSVAFYTHVDRNVHHDGYPFTIFTSLAGKVFAYDLRNTSSPIIKYDPSISYSIPSLEGEEINQLQLCYDANCKVQYLATADDDGSCRMIHPVPLGIKTSSTTTKSSSNTSSQATKHQHPPNLIKPLIHSSNPLDDTTLVTSIAFRPTTKSKLDQLELITGGTDCTICLWDASKRTKKSIFTISPLERNNSTTLQICNPPIVHSTCWSSSGRLLSAGLGDGSILLLKPEGRRLVEAFRISGNTLAGPGLVGHSSAVANVLFPSFGHAFQSSSHVTSEDRLLITGGNDGNIIFWDLGPYICGEYAVDPKKYLSVDDDIDDQCDEELHHEFSSSLKLKENRHHQRDDNDDVGGGADPKVLFAMHQNEKLNCIVSSDTSDAVYSNSIFVGDTSNDITIYTLPI